MTIIIKIDQQHGHIYILEQLDSKTALVAPDKVPMLEKLVKEHIQKHMPDVEGSDIE
ncbi:hypothetical protein EJ08DRAFT_703423 [Tothia fuscella]|uniref:General transcription and DNA repair factor IIH subunit TFB5 n=1 Tax=Tothia fuscella TaxID=1048955 RepID=A0A9P4TSI8_9PEZI|nr:hypothetical protein EJ08DRAFT_703423 [Tothia fuscella]